METQPDTEIKLFIFHNIYQYNIIYSEKLLLNNSANMLYIRSML